jgi:DNA processing protein
MSLKPLNNPQFPKRLCNVKHPPNEIYYKGDITLLNSERNIAVIGSRHVSDNGLRRAYSIGSKLAKMDINVVNGLAIGCDTYALKGALSIGGKCIAVMPCGLDQIVPKSNYRLADEVLAKGGLLISEYPIGSEVEKYMYVERDRLQSGISKGVIVVEAGFKSGTMYAVRAAQRQGKPVACCKYAEIAREASYCIIDSDNDLEAFVSEAFNTIEYMQVDINDYMIKNIQ